MHEQVLFKEKILVCKVGHALGRDTVDGRRQGACNAVRAVLPGLAFADNGCCAGSTHSSATTHTRFDGFTVCQRKVAPHTLRSAAIKRCLKQIAPIFLSRVVVFPSRKFRSALHHAALVGMHYVGADTWTTVLRYLASLQGRHFYCRFENRPI